VVKTMLRPISERGLNVPNNPVLEITADDAATIVKDGQRLEISGPVAAVIITAYRHVLTHKDTGHTDAALYLWGALDGMRYSLVEDAKRTLRDIEERRIPPDFTSQRR